MLCQTDTLRVHRRNGAVSAKSHAKHLGQTVHAVGRVHTGAGTAGGAGLVFILQKALVVQKARRVGSNSLKHAGETGLFALYPACHHRASADKDGGDVDSCGSHQKSRHVLVTVWHHDQSVELMGHGHGLGGVRDQIPCHQGVFHADMAHGNAVTDRNGRKYDGRSACHGNSHFYSLHNLVQVHMPRHDFIVGADDTDQRTIQLLLCQSQRVK